MRKHVLFTAMLWLAFLTACETDSYEKGEGRYSLLQADFAELHVDGQKRGSSFTTDDGATLQLAQPFTAKWIETADTTYRTIVYYSEGADKSQQWSTGPNNIFVTQEAIGMVATLHPIAYWRFKELPEDPIGLESAWLSKNGKYLNLGLLVKTGRIGDEELPHNIGLAQDTVYVRNDGRHTVRWRLLHSQNGIPQYYTNRRYISILMPTNVPDTILLSIPTEQGPLQRTFIPNKQ